MSSPFHSAARISRNLKWSCMTVGIDLGTTNCALAYVNPAEAEEADFPPIHLLDIPQHVEQTVIEPRRVLPSFLYLGEERYAGVYAREQGALVPTRVVSSAKSLALERGSGPNGQDPSLGCPGFRPRDLAGGGFSRVPY